MTSTVAILASTLLALVLGHSRTRASRSLLRRWESGEIPISYEGLSAYETALGLEVGQISSITGYIKASIPGLRTRVVARSSTLRLVRSRTGWTS